MLLTNFFAEYFGLILTIFAISMFVHKEMYMELIHDLEHKRSTIYVLSVCAVIVGLFAVMLHNIWHGNSIDIIVTVIAWIILLKGVLYLVLPTRTVRHIIHGVAFARNYPLYAIIALIVGLYLIVAAFGGY